MTQPILAAALAWHDTGACVIPARADGSKAPFGQWADYQQTRPSRDTLTGWLTDTRYDGIGLICGAVSGELEMFEFEGRALTENIHQQLGQLLADHGHADLWTRLITGYLETTPGGGIHLMYRVDGAARRNLKLARRPATTDELTANPDEKIKVLIETRGGGGFTIVAPSGGRTHPTGKPWQLLQGGPATVPLITEDERDALHAIAGMLDRTPETPTAAGPGSDTDRWLAGHTAHHSGTLRPGDDYNQRATWTDILGPHGWQAVTRYGTATGWRRPGKNIGVSATTGRNDADNLYVFSSSTEFETEKPYSKFGAYTLLEHDGDFRAAASALRTAGYGQPTEPPPLRLVNTNDSTPLIPDAPAHGQPAIIDRTSWWPRDLAPILAGDDNADPEPAYLARDDGRRLLYAGKVNGLIGESESGKTWVALIAVLQAIQVGEAVLYLDFEDSAPGIVNRLRALGATDRHLQHLTYISPDEDLHIVARRDLVETMQITQPKLIVLDGVNAAMTLLGLDLEKNKDVTHFSYTVLRQLTATGAAVCTIDHVTKSKEGRGNFAIGAQAKRSDINGCALIVEAQQPFGRGMTGKLRLTVSKDRAGHVRAHAGGGKYAGTVHLVSDGDTGMIESRVISPDPRPVEERPVFRPTGLMEKVSRFLETLPDGGASGSVIEKNVGGKAEYIRAALDVLVTESHVGRSAGPRGAVLHSLLLPYREAEDFGQSPTPSPPRPTSSHLVPPRPGTGSGPPVPTSSPYPSPLRGGDEVEGPGTTTSEDDDLVPDEDSQQEDIW